MQPVHPKGSQPWIFSGRTDAEAEILILWPPDAKNWLTGKDPDAGKDWGQEEKGATEDEKVEWHHQVNAHEFEQTQGDPEGQGSLVFCSPWSLKSWTWLSNWTTAIFFELHGGPAAKTLSSHCRGKGLILGWGTKISYAAWLGQKEMNHGYGMYGVGNIICNYVISLYGNILWLDCDHFDVYRNIESLCWVTGTHIVL